MPNQNEEHAGFLGRLYNGTDRLGRLSAKSSRPAIQYMLAFFLPFCIIGLVWAIGGVWPFGNRMILVQDMWHQYYPFLVDFRDKLQNGHSLFYSWTTGMGTSYFGLFAYYLASPLNFLSVFVPENLLLSYFALEVLIKISCAGLFFAIFARKTLDLRDNTLPFFSLMYALCSFIMGYYWNTMWLDTIALLPLLICGTFALLKDKKFILYTVALTLSVLSSYYVGLFVCIFVLLVFIGYNICNWDDFGGFFRRLLRIGIFTLLALGMTALLTVPAYMGLQSASSTIGNAFPASFAINIGKSSNLLGVIDAFRKVMANAGAVIAPTSRTGLPNVACGVASLLLAVMFFTCKRIKLREKLYCGFLLLFLIYSFISRRLDFVWHGGHFPNMLPYRFSFLYCFTVLYMAVRAYKNIERVKWYHVACIAPFLLAFLFCVVTEDTRRTIVVTCGIIVAGCAALVLYSLKKLPRHWLSLLLCLCLLTEGIISGGVGVDQVTLTTRTGYPPEAQDVKNVIAQMEERERDTTDLYRAECTTTKTLNDNALNGYNGISIFSSAANAKVSAFMAMLGQGGHMAGNRYAYQQSDPFCNLLLNLKYLISRDGDYQDHVNFTQAGTSGRVLLLENTQYLPLGWMLEDSLLQFDTQKAEENRNRIDNLNTFYQLATGSHSNLYTNIPVTDTRNTGDCTAYISEGNRITVTRAEGEAEKNYVELNYLISHTSTFSMYAMAEKDMDTIQILVNDTQVRSENCRYGYVLYLGELKAGDALTVRLSPTEIGTAGARICLAEFDMEAFEQMRESFSESGLKLTKLTDTELEGVITVKKAGLLYTSVPADKGWSAEVDGEKAEITPIGGALIALHLEPGRHTIRLHFETPGFSTAWKISLACLLLFVLLAIISLLRKACTPSIRRVAIDMAEREEPEEENGSAMPPLTLSEEPCEYTRRFRPLQEDEAEPDGESAEPEVGFDTTEPERLPEPEEERTEPEG